MSLTTDAGPLARDAAAGANPATRRRMIFAGLGVATWALLFGLAAFALAPGGYDALDLLILVAFGLHLPWSIFGFWNAWIGFLIMRFAKDPLALTCPPAASVRGDEPITATTAILMCVRNEDTTRVFRNIGLLLGDLAKTGAADRFRLYVLSDTNRADVAAAEEAAVETLRVVHGGRFEIVYRRRETNPGFKAGNIRDFLDRWGRDNEFMLTLDADSFMSAAQILKMVRILQASPKLGILQSLTVGLPSTSPLARLFQFGMRLGMRSYTMGSAWWHADCGPYWGHNALIRVEPFREHCHLPKLPGGPPLGGDILSHDQVEAVLMRKAGYEVRVIPIEGGSFEENPPTLIEFIRRDMRWCLGNTQYWKLLDMKGILPTSRFQLIVAVLMFVASPSFILMWGLTLVQALLSRGEAWVAAGPALTLIAVMAAMMFAPKIASAIDVLSRREARASFGGGFRFVIGLVTETVFALMLTPITTFSHMLMMGALAFGRTVGWTSQQRDAHSVPWREAFARLWPHTVLGLAAGAGLLSFSLAAFLYATPVFLGLLLAVPFTVLTSSPAFGRFMTAVGWCRIPEEVVVPLELQPLDLPALAAARA